MFHATGTLDNPSILPSCSIIAVSLHNTIELIITLASIYINNAYRYNTRQEYDEALPVIEELLLPLIEKCKEKNRAMRIGTNHGSLSARVMSFWGDSPRGMVESALEFAQICR